MEPLAHGMIYYIIGIRRSGLHAIANWLFPMMGEYIYLNNYELGKLTDIEMVVHGNFNVIIGVENKEVEEIMKYCIKGKRIWVERDWFQIKKSQQTWYKKEGLSDEEIQDKVSNSFLLYLDYFGVDEFRIDYNKWKDDIEYRQDIAGGLWLKFNDSNKEKVFGYGQSSFA